MTQRHDSESRSRRLTEDARPAKVGRVRKLEERVKALEDALDEFKNHIHAQNGNVFVRTPLIRESDDDIVDNTT